MVEHIGSKIGLPHLDVLPSARQHYPSASVLPALVLSQPQGVSSQSQSLSVLVSLFIWRMKVKWNSLSLSLSLFKILSDSLFLTVIVCCFCLALFITLIIFVLVFGFIRWCWWDTINCLLVLVLVSFGENCEIQLIDFIWLVLVLWLRAMGHWSLSVELGGGWGHGFVVNAHGVCGCVLVQ